jgi:hypothetical protein
MRRIFVVLALIFGLALATVPVATSPASAWGTHSSTPPPGSTTIGNITIGPFMTMILNKIIKSLGPVLCPALGGLTNDGFQQYVVDFCNQMVASDNPLGQLAQFIPLLCQPGIADAVLVPAVAKFVPLICGILGLP